MQTMVVAPAPVGAESKPIKALQTPNRVEVHMHSKTWLISMGKEVIFEADMM